MARKIQPRSNVPKPKKGQSSEDYWRERETRQRAANIHDEARYAARINDIFQSTQDSIQQEIESFYQRYASKEGIDIAEARHRVSKIDMEKYERLAAQYVKAAHEGGREAAFSDEANEQMRLYNATMRINRLEMLKARCGIRAMEGYRLADQLINEALEERTYSEYYRLAGILGNTVQFNENMVRSIVNASYQNATWSQRLWNNQALLSERIGAQIAQGILTGKGSDVLARNIQKLTGQSTFACQRLMRTELRRVQTAAAEQSMLDNGVTEYKFLVANGINPCDECLALDGKVFKISEMSVGKNAPPKHPLCHCCTCPALDEEKWQRWVESGAARVGISYEEFTTAQKNGTFIDDVIVRMNKLIGRSDEEFEDNKRMLEKLGFEKPDNSLRRCDQGLLKNNIIQLENLEKRFGILGIAADKNVWLDVKEPALAYTLVWPSNKNLELAFCAEFMDRNGLIQKVRIRQENNRYMPTDTSDSTVSLYVITHEYGHMLQHMLYMSTRESDYTKSEMEFFADCKNEIIDIAVKENARFDYMASISEYGGKNDAEFFAEVFANSQLGKPNELGIAMETWLKQHGF